MTRVSFQVRVTPRAGVDAVAGVGDAGQLLVRVRAPAAGGAANKALIRTLAAALDRAPSLVSIDSGLSSRTKRIVVEDLDSATLEVRWPGLQTRQD